MKTGLLVAMLALVGWMLYQRRPPSPPIEAVATSDPPPEAPTEPPRAMDRRAKPAVRAVSSKKSVDTDPRNQTVYRYAPPFRPKEQLPKPLRGNLHAQQLLIVLEEAEVNPAIIQFEFKNIYNSLVNIKEWRYHQAAEVVANHDKIAEILNRSAKDPDAMEDALRMRDSDDFSNPIGFQRFIEEERQRILTALAGTRIASDPDLQQKLFSIQAQLALSPEATEYMKSYSPATTGSGP
jgi:hypothetical protein